MLKSKTHALQGRYGSGRLAWSRHGLAKWAQSELSKLKTRALPRWYGPASLAWSRHGRARAALARRDASCNFSTSTIMPTRKSSGQRPGRPRSGKIGYTVRMPPETYKAWCRVARDDGFQHLGDFLASLPGFSLEPDTRLQTS